MLGGRISAHDEDEVEEELEALEREVTGKISQKLPTGPETTLPDLQPVPNHEPVHSAAEQPQKQKLEAIPAS
jgi:charged multivesicular body protein 6